jgi:hypothetical protein
MPASGRNNPGTLGLETALQHDIPSVQARKRRLSYGLLDVFVIAACSLTFAAVIGAARHGEPKGPPIELIAQDPGTTPEAFRQAADRFLPHRPMGPPTEAQKKQVAALLDVSVEQLDAVMGKYRPDRLRQR